MSPHKPAWLSIVVIMAAVALLLFMLIEPFLSLPPIWEQASVGIVLTLSGAIWLFGAAAIQEVVLSYRSARKSRAIQQPITSDTLARRDRMN